MISGCHARNYVGLGRYLHFLQDSFSHAGYESDTWGHARDEHYYDKTASDVPKAMRMAGATWNALNEFAKQKCNCHGAWDPSWWQQVKDFSEVQTRFPIDAAIDANYEWDNSFSPGDPVALDRKRRILGVPLR